MEKQEDQFRVATEIAIEAGVLQRCEHCDSTVFQGDEDVTEAYKLGNSKFSRDEVTTVFATRAEMTDAIKSACESGDHAGECCFHCDEKIFGDD
ncbi:hypothetical protein [Aeromonas hydrophila]|uniref:hypothetical protein n=2 Tax=Aeromonas TaxID=642 RepID=UPI0038D0BBFF